MIDEARGDAQAAAYSQQRWPIEASLAWQAARALLAALGVLALLFVVFRATPLAHVPDYPAVMLAFLLSIVVPGYFVQRALLSGAHPLAKLAAMPGLGLALVALPGFLALEVHTSLDRFGVMYAVFASIACGVSVLFWHDERTPSGERARAGMSPLTLAMLLIVIGGIVTTPYWANDRISGDFDDWTYMAYVRDYVGADHMNQHEPFLGTDGAVTPRMRDNVWVLTQALVSDTSGVPPNDVLLEYLRPMLTVFALLATFALTWTLFKDTAIGLLAMLFQAGYALIDLAPHEGMGRNLLMRISEDKMIGAFLLFPIGLVFVARFTERRSPAAAVGFTVIALAISLVHPVPLAFLAITIGALAALRFAQDRDARSAALLGLLLVPVAAGSIWPFVQRQLLHGTAPELFGTEESAITFRGVFRVTELGHGFVIGNYHMVIHPLVLAAIVITPLVWVSARRALGSQVLAAMTAGALIAFFVPLFSSPLSSVMTPQTLWKVPWMIPVGPILAYAVFHGLQRLSGFTSGVRAEAVRALGPGTAVVLVLAAALLVQEQYTHLDHRYFYDGAGHTPLIPGTSASIFRGGVNRAFSGLWRVGPDERRLFQYLDQNIPPDSVVLAEPPLLNRMMPGLLSDVYPVDFGGAAGEGQRRDDVNAFIQGQLSEPSQLDAVIDRWRVSYIVVREVGAANQALLGYQRIELLEEVSPYEIYEVRR